MGPMSWCLKPRRRNIALLLAVGLWPTAAAAQDLKISAHTDKAAIEVGAQVTLMVTIEGDAAKAELKPVDFPKGIVVLAQQQASNMSVQAGQVSQHSMSLIYLLTAQEPGTYALGPFQLTQQGKTYTTEPIRLIVSKPLLPPTRKEHQRYYL